MSRKAKILVLMLLAACGLLAVAIPNYIRARQGSGANARTNNPRQTDEAKKESELKSSTTNIQVGGFLQMEPYVNRLLRSRQEFAAVFVATQDGHYALLMIRQAGRTVLRVRPGGPPYRPWNNAEETKIREFFSKRGMTPSEEVRSANPIHAQGRYGFEFRLSDNPKTIAQLCVSVFTDLAGSTDQHGVSIRTFEM